MTSTAQADAATVARQAAALEEALGLVDTGAFARRGSPGEAPERRTAVDLVAARLYDARVSLLMWAIHGRCDGLTLADGSPWPAHPVEEHRPVAEDGVRLLFPEAVV